MENKVNSKIINFDGALYDENGHIVGHAPFDTVQIDTLSFQPLSEKVLQILTGDPTFHAEDINSEYDEEEGEWDKDANDDVEIDSIDEYTDASDIFDMKNDLNEKIENVKATVVEEGKNQPADAIETSTESPKEEKQQ